MKPSGNWMLGVALSLLVSACAAVADPAPPATASSLGPPAAVIGEAAPDLVSALHAAGFVSVDPEPAELRAVEGRPYVVAQHVAPGGFARVSILDDPVSRVIFSAATDDAALDAFRAILADRGLVEARDWLDHQQTRAASDPTADISDQTVLPGGVPIAYKRVVAGNDPSTAVVTVIVGP